MSDALPDASAFAPVRHETGRFILSFDFEIGWGSIESGLWRPREAAGVYERLRPEMNRLLAEMDALETPATWAAVGAMIDAPAPDRFDHLPDEAAAAARAFLAEALPATQDGRDLWDRVHRAEAGHDLGSHTYSHTRFTFPGFDAGAQHADMALARAALGRRGAAAARSFVWPLNHAGGIEALTATGFDRLRTAPEARGGGRLAKLMRAALSSAPLAREAAQGGAALQSGSMFYNWRRGRDAPLRRRLIERQVRRSLDEAERSGGTLHLWLHPFNLSETPGLTDGLIGVLRDVARRRDAARLHVATMASA